MFERLSFFPSRGCVKPWYYKIEGHICLAFSTCYWPVQNRTISCQATSSWDFCLLRSSQNVFYVIVLVEFRSHMELDRANVAAALVRPHLQLIKKVSASATMSGVNHHTRGFLKWEGLQKKRHIYADWIDDIPLRICSSISIAGTWVPRFKDHIFRQTCFAFMSFSCHQVAK